MNKLEKLSDLPNIGKVSEKQLVGIGIKTKEDLEELGSKETWLKIKEIDSSACYHKLCALEGAIQNIRWFDLEEADKKNLKDFYNNYK